jgi:putative N6-adenine-specific DNA methylase
MGNNAGRAGKSRILVTCAKGIAPFLREEIASLGLPVLSETVAGVETEGGLDDAMRVNLFVRTGHRVLFLLDSFAAANADDLYESVSRIPWEDSIPEDGYISVTSSVENLTIRDSRFANVRCKDAIVDRMQRKYGKRPDSGPERDRTVIALYWKDEECAVYLDTSGEPLSKRGYRKIPLRAPMQETLAAAVIAATGWQGEGSVVNPMCGSGTLAIEAVLIGLNRAPGLLRSNYGFMHLKDFDAALWKELRAEARAKARKNLEGRIVASDHNAEALAAAKQNAMTAGVEQLIEFASCDFRETPIPGGGGIVVLNPEYGERMGRIASLEETYKGIGDFFKQRCGGYRGYVFTGNPELAKKIGLRAKRRIPFFNGPIECRLLEYELYEGSRRARPS